MTSAHINRIATSVPPYDVHEVFVDYACDRLVEDPRKSKLIRRLAEQGQIDHRYSVLQPAADGSSATNQGEPLFVHGTFPSTAARMRLFEKLAPKLAYNAVGGLGLGRDRAAVSHLIVTCCTGFSAPGVDLQIVEECGFAPDVERTFVGFMGCYAAINGLNLARHIVRSEPTSKVLLVNLELCTLHLQETHDLEQILSFFLFADGCAASLISSEPVGVEITSFHSILAPKTADLITWNIGDSGFDMILSGQVPSAIHSALCGRAEAILGGHSVDEIELWAVHPGGRSVLDAVEHSMDLPPSALAASREVLRSFGNMSSATVMFVLKRLMEGMRPGQNGCAMAFGPGLVAETMRFRAVG